MAGTAAVLEPENLLLEELGEGWIGHNILTLLTSGWTPHTGVLGAAGDESTGHCLLPLNLCRFPARGTLGTNSTA